LSALQVDVPEALQPLLNPARYKGAFGGRGGAKSHFFAEQLILRCFSRQTRAVCVREVQNSLKESVRQLLIDKIEKFKLNGFFQVLDAEIRAKNGSLIIFKGMQSYNADSIKSLEGYDIAWVEEAQSLSHHSLRLLRPTIRKDDSELWFSWNPRHKRDAIDEFFRAGAPHPKSICVPVNWSDNPWFPKELQDEKNFDYARDPEMADHVWGGNYEIVTEGAYYAKLLFEAEKSGRITNVPYDPSEPVYTAWDLGLDDSTAVWFAQIIAREVRIIDYYEVRNVALIDIAKSIRERQYVYAEHYLPHDVETREISTAKTRKEQLEAVKLIPIVAGSKLPVVDGINAVRTMLPTCVFDATKCEKGLEALRNYRTEHDEEKDTNKLKPLHDWSSHGADAFRELAVNLFDVRQAKNVPDQAITDYNPYETPDSWVRDDQTSGVEDYNPW
jgi:phage terminase large subunit